MKSMMRDQLRVALQLLAVVVAYGCLGVVLLGGAEGMWRIPAALVMAFFLPVLVSSAMQFYWQLCRPVWRKIAKAI
jgi:hypothetical protein